MNHQGLNKIFTVIKVNYRFIIYLFIIIVVSESCTTRKEFVKSYSLEISDLTEDQIEIYNEYALRIKPWKKQYEYNSNNIEGLRIPIDSLYFIYNYLEKDISMNLHYPLVDRFWIINHKGISGEDLLTSLSYLAQQGNEEIEKMLLTNFEYTFKYYIDDFNEGLILTTPANRLYFVAFQAFNRLPPSIRKIKLLFSLQGHSKDLGRIENYEYTNYYPFNYLLLNFEDSAVDSFYYQSGTNYLQILESSKYKKAHANEKDLGYLNWKFNKLFPQFKVKYDKGQLKLKSRDYWKKLDIPLWGGITYCN